MIKAQKEKRKRIFKTLDAAMNSAKSEAGRNRIEEIQLCFEGYSEPGYSNPECGIVALGNWNDVDEYDTRFKQRERLEKVVSRCGEVLEKLGVECEWSDEWLCCDDCGKLVRTSSDSYFWKPSFVEIQGSILCRYCVDPEEYLERLERRPRIAETLGIDPGEHGYKCLEEGLEAGSFEGQTDDPVKIAKKLEEEGTKRYLFKLDEQSQFYIRFSVWAKDENE